MNFWRCKCGEETAYESGMPPRDCQGCRKCGTTLAMRLDDHKPLHPHIPRAVYSRLSGKFEYWECGECFERLDDNEQEMPQEKSK